jgi:nucleotide-binding universal stress UspA family protein
VSESSPSNRRFARILLATDGRPIPDSTIARVLELAPLWGASARVVSIVRIYGHSFGLANTGPLPTRHDWERHRVIVADAVKRLSGRGVEICADVVATRKPAKRICDEAMNQGCEAIVMAAGPNRSRLIGNMLWSQEPQRVRRRARVPVFLVSDETRRSSVRDLAPGALRLSR